jgi:nickel/cobalt transporter (NiCoT) family protein
MGRAQPGTIKGFTRNELIRLGGLCGFIGLLHVLGWGFFLYYAHDFGRVYAGAGALAYTFGLRHAFDADHISAVDDTTRLLMQKDKRPLGVGFFFSLGHSTIVLLLALAIGVGAQAVHEHLETLQDVGGVIGATVSGTFLWAVGIFNLVVLAGMVKIWRRMKEGNFDEEQLEELLLQRGFMNRFFGGRFRAFMNESWQMYPVGLLFGLGFDTASEVGLLATTASAATQTSGVGVERIPLLGIVALPLLFAAGMSMMDTADGVFMMKAYGWAFSSPLRKIYCNMTMTALSIFVALGIGTIEYLHATSAKLHLNNGFFAWLNRLDFSVLGYAIVAVFLTTWMTSIAIFKVLRVEERWGKAASG